MNDKFSISNAAKVQKEKEYGLPSYSFSEELLNAITHGIGILFSLFAFVFLILNSPCTLGSIIGTTIYCMSLFVLYTGSTLYHAVGVSKLKSRLRKFDHCSIFVLIAGTHTPLCINYIKGLESKIVLIAVWIAAIIGIIINAIDVNKYSKISLGCYIVMGWSVLFMAKPTLYYLTVKQLIWLLIGGIFYTVGAIIYVVGKKIKYMHSIWHLFVLAGSVSHFIVFTI